MPEIIAVTRDDVRHVFPCPESTYVLDAAEAAGLYLPSVCRHGRCGTCWAQVVSGKFDLAPYYTTTALPPAPGSVLLCRCKPRENLTVHLPCRDAQIGRRHIPERRAVIEAVTPLGAGWVALTLRLVPDPQYGQEAVFTPGQYMELSLPGTAERHALAMANRPNDAGWLEFLLPEGVLAGARRGAEMVLRGPLGSFMLDEMSPRPRCLVGEGGGLAPLLAMLRHLADLRDRTRLQLIFVAEPAMLPFLEKSLAPLRGGLPQLMVTLVPGLGDAAAGLAAHLAKVPGSGIYACGSLQLLGLVADVASAHGVPAANIRAEPALV